MAGKRFSKEEIEALKRSPYIAKASPIQVSFTTDFKQIAYQELTEGKTMRTILEESGINPEILGERRISLDRACEKKSVKEPSMKLQ